MDDLAYSEDYYITPLKLKTIKELLEEGDTITPFLKSLSDDMDVKTYYNDKYLDAIEIRFDNKEKNIER